MNAQDAVGGSPTSNQGFAYASVNQGPIPGQYADSDDETAWGQRSGPMPERSWWQRLRDGPGPPPALPPSGYLTLIPLSDSRLKPQNYNLIIALLLLAATSAVTGVFFLVPRGVTVGSIQVHSSQISFNTSKSTYQILLTATIPVFNPNYLSVRLYGTVNVSFYDQQAGFTSVGPVTIPARAQPQVFSVDMDASSVPQKYLFTIYTQCFTFPEKLIFFLQGSLEAQYLGKRFDLPRIDNYFILSCTSSGHDALEWDAGMCRHLDAQRRLPHAHQETA